jgi:hypothetical protein
MKPFMPLFLLLPMAMGVNCQQDKNDNTSPDHDEKGWAVLPNQRNKVANI